MLFIPVILLVASICHDVLGSKAKAGTKGTEVKGATRQRTAPPKVTWEDCVEFHYEDCREENTPKGNTRFDDLGEGSCYSGCYDNTAFTPPNECGTYLGPISPNPNNRPECFRGTSKNTHEITTTLCNIRRGMVIKGGGKRNALEGCLDGGIMCMRGECDMDGHLDLIIQTNQVVVQTELECMHRCWNHGNPNTGDCTHYKWVEKTKYCEFYKRKNPLTDTETNYQCQLYSYPMYKTDEFGLKDVGACKSGGVKYYKATDSCGAMCDASHPARIQFPIGVAIDTSSTQKDDHPKFFKIMEQLTNAPSYQLVEFGKNDTTNFPRRSNYTQFRVDLHSLVFNGSIPNRYEFFSKGLKPLCERAEPSSFLLATLDEHTNNLELETEIAKCLIDKKATLFIALNPTFTNSTESLDAYTRLAEGSGGKVVDISKDDSLLTSIDNAMQTICQCTLADVIKFPNGTATI